MRTRNIFLFFCTLLIFTQNVSAAKEFDEVFFKKNLQTKIYPVDTDASAIVLYENITDYITTDNYRYTRKKIVHKIIKILKSDAVDEGNVSVRYTIYDYNNYLDVNKIKATTYNLINGAIIASVVATKDMLKKKISEHVYTLSFSMPAVKEGSIIDYSYEVMMNYHEENLAWHIQGDHPKLMAEYCLIFPATLEYTFINHVGMESKEYPSDEDAELGPDSFCYAKRTYATSEKAFWLRRNVKALKDEPYIVNRINQTEQLELQMTAMAGQFRAEHFNNSWEKINKILWEKIGLKSAINANNRFFRKVVDSLTTPEMSALDKTYSIYRYVRSNFKMTEQSNNVSELNFKRIFADKEGDLNEINLLLTAMLVSAEVDASPIMLSTTDKLSPTAVFPVLDRMNYLACIVKSEDGVILLDASNKYYSFGMLPQYCYNGYALVLGNVPKGITLNREMIKDKTTFIINMRDFNDSSAKFEAIFKMGMIRSAMYRNSWAEHKEKSKTDIAELKKVLPTNANILETAIENEDNADTNLIVKFTCSLELEKNSNFFLNANLIRFFDRNPFKSALRQNLIEFPFKTEYQYYMNIKLPENIEPDSLTTPVTLDFEEGAMRYKHVVGYYSQLHILTVNSSLAINTTTYGVDKYNGIRQFFQAVIDDNNKIIEFKKTAK